MLDLRESLIAFECFSAKLVRLLMFVFASGPLVSLVIANLFMVLNLILGDHLSGRFEFCLNLFVNYLNITCFTAPIIDR